MASHMIRGQRTITLSAQANEVYEVQFKKEDIVDVLNGTESSLRLSVGEANELTDTEGNIIGDTGITLPAGTAVNDLRLIDGDLCITPSENGNIVIVRH